jgi:CHAD domain-containing protein
MLGAIRNCDEALLFFSPLAGECDASARAKVLHIVARLQEQREAEKRKLKRELKKIDSGSLLGRIDDVCRNPRIFNTAAEVLFQPVATCILKAIAVREKNILELLPEALVEENASAQHRLRIAVKHFRYRMEFLALFTSGDYKTVYSKIKEYQELLGKMHDLDVFSNLIAAPADNPEQNRALKSIIKARRRVLFNDFLLLHTTVPLDTMGDLVRGVLCETCS